MDSKKYKDVIFDLDNTLIDSGNKIKTDIIETFQRLGKTISPTESTDNWYELAESYGINKEQFDKELDKRKSWEQALRDGDVQVFPETPSVLKELKNKGVRISLLSKSIPEYTKQKLDYFGLTPYFTKISTIHPREPSKRQGALNLIKSLDPKTIEKAYFIGDKEEDIVIANDIRQEYGIDSEGIYVNRNGTQLNGFHNIKSLEGVLNII